MGGGGRAPLYEARMEFLEKVSPTPLSSPPPRDLAISYSTFPNAIAKGRVHHAQLVEGRSEGGEASIFPGGAIFVYRMSCNVSKLGPQ